MRARWALAVPVLLGLVLASGCAQAARAQATVCLDVAWGGYDGDARCAALARRTIAGADRACRTDADCALIHPGASCREGAVSAASLGRYRAMEAACTDPGGGPCNPATARCSGGCCVEGR